MDGSLCSVNRAIARHKNVSTKPAAGKLRQALRVPQPQARRGWDEPPVWDSETTRG